MEINKDIMVSNLLFNKPFQYKDNIIINPIYMKDIILFQMCQQVLILRKDSVFQDKHILKMGYLEFIKFAHQNNELAEKYNIPMLPVYYSLLLELFGLVFDKSVQIQYNQETLDITINDIMVTEEVFDDLRRIIILQNDIDFDIDEFINIETLEALERAREFEAKKNKEKAELEDYIDSLIIELKVTEEYVSNLSIRKFWRYIKRINKHEQYKTLKTAEMSGMVTIKEPVQHWMTSVDSEDKYAGIKTDESEIRSTYH